MVATEFRHDEAGTPQSVWAADPSWATVPPVELDPQLQRIVVVAAHPDDESLGTAGLLATASDLGISVELVLATAGEASHPQSPTLPPDRLARARLAESRAALAEVAAGSATTYLRVPDGQVEAFEEHLVDALVRIVGDGRHTLMLSPWRHDGHPDHEACGRAAAVAARRSGAELLQYPVWFWHWGTSKHMPWSRVRRLALSPSAMA
ncbi:PIG-L deacetylase family protein, partial [Nocardioides hankookensis]